MRTMREDVVGPQLALHIYLNIQERVMPVVGREMQA